MILYKTPLGSGVALMLIVEKCDEVKLLGANTFWNRIYMEKGGAVAQ